MVFAPFARSEIKLWTDRVSQEDGDRQERTAEEILRRLEARPGVILADEVGMGKTFVAMAVAASIILARPDDGPVVVMVPPSLRHKWPKDWSVFKEKCLSRDLKIDIRHGEADTGIDFLKLLDDPPERKRHIIFLTHGALDRALTDGYAKLAVIKRAFKWRSSLGEQRKNFHKFAGRILRMESVERKAPGLLGELLEKPYENWLGAIHDAHDDFRESVQDDPVPRHLQEALDEIEREAIDPVVEQLRRLPLRESGNIDERLKEARRALVDVMSEIWRVALKRARFESPLLIFDEAHHLKNPATKLASLFVDEEAARESKYFETSGALGRKFERMLFLTATPFQLGHGELVRVLERFEGIAWQSSRPPSITRKDFRSQIETLAKALDEAQTAALQLDHAWGRLTDAHLTGADGKPLDVDRWWEEAQENPGDAVVEQVVARVNTARQRMRVAEDLLRPWVLRHLKSKFMSYQSGQIERRLLLPGAAINGSMAGDMGLEIEGEAFFPFLLAGRAQAIMATSTRGRALFAEGLSSSFEAYIETRSTNAVADEDGDLQQQDLPEEVNWYLEHLDRALPQDDQAAWAAHPKIRATAERAVQLWREGEKVLVFCHYRATGRALRRHISARLDEEIIALGQKKLHSLSSDKVRDELERIGKRFFDVDGLLRNEVVAALHRIIEPFESLRPGEILKIVDVVRRFLRTASFLVRYFEPAEADHASAFADAIERWDVGGLSLRQRIDDFCSFLSNQCTQMEREGYLDALDSIQTGSHIGRDITARLDQHEEDGDLHRTVLLPNVRLASGLVSHDTRRKLLLAFNTPFFPEILIASSVLAEGVDLHINCRHIIHHDLCWNPSTLEQRIGRVDRLGSLAENIGEPIKIYLPYIAATQDEKMYRVVRDRERWFQIIMGDKYEVDEASTDKQARRIPLPEVLQNELILDLSVE